MDATEKLVHQYLVNNGYEDIVYEPNGNIPPDFLVNRNIAVEATRLNIHYLSNDRKPYAHEQYLVPFRQYIRALLPGYGPALNGETWAVSFGLIHPMKKLEKIKSSVKNCLLDFQKSKNRVPSSHIIMNSLEINFDRVGCNYNNFYIMGSDAEDVTGCFIMDEMYRNIAHISAEKNKKVEGYREKYTEWWLGLVDCISYELSYEDYMELKALPRVGSEWSKIIIINSAYPHNAFVIE